MAEDSEGLAGVADSRSRLFTRCVTQAVLEVLPDAIGIYDPAGTLVANNAAFNRFWQLPADHGLIGRLNLLTAPGVDPDDVSMFRATCDGACVESAVHPIDLRSDPAFDELGRKQLWMQTLFAPLRVDDAVEFVMITFRDRSDEVDSQTRIVETQTMVEEQRETIAALRAAQEHIRRQQDTISELSTPIIEVWPGVLTLPVVGHIDERRAGEMTERLLLRVTALRARHVILDLTGVARLDAATADHMLRILRAVPLLGGQTMITGIHPAVAETIVDLGLDLRAIRTVRSLREALTEIVAAPARSGPGG